MNVERKTNILLGLFIATLCSPLIICKPSAKVIDNLCEKILRHMNSVALSPLKTPSTKGKSMENATANPEITPTPETTPKPKVIAKATPKVNTPPTSLVREN